jgi:hypothetical protein
MKSYLNKLLFFLFLYTFVHPLTAQPIRLSMPDTTGVNGDTITIPVYVDSSLTGYNVVSYQLQINYTSTILMLDSVLDTGTLTENLGWFSFNQSQSNQVTIAGAGSSPLEGTGILIYIRFIIHSAGTAYLNFSGTQANYFNEGDPPMDLVNGRVVATNPPVITVSPNSALLMTGETYQFFVSGAQAPLQWSVSNPDVASIDDSGLLTALDRGFTRVLVEDDNGSIDSTDNFIEVRSLQLSMPDTSVLQGQSLDIPVRITDISDLGIISGTFTITFNAARLTAVAIDQTGSLTEGIAQIYANYGAGQVTISFANSTALTGAGDLLYIRFTASMTSYGSSSLNLSGILFNEEIEATIDNGSCSVTQLPTLSISPSSSQLMVGQDQQFSVSGGTPPYSWAAVNEALVNIDDTGLLNAIASGQTSISVTDAFGATGSSGPIEIYDSQVTLPDTQAAIGFLFDFPFFIDGVPAGLSVSSVQATVSCDTSVMRPVEVITAGTLTSGWSFASRIEGVSMTFAGAHSTGFTEGGTLLKIRFQISPTIAAGEESGVTLSNLLFNEGEPRALTEDGSVVTIPPTIPGASTLDSPPDGATGVSINPMLCWNAVNGAQNYRLQLSLNNDFSTIVIDSTNLVSTCLEIEGLDYNTVYYWRVQASNIAGTGDWSSVWSFTTELPAAPMAPILSSPENNITNAPLELLLCWYPVEGAQSYRLQLALAGDFAAVLIDSLNVADTCLTISDLEYNTVYYWRVAAENIGGISDWSEVWQFQSLVDGLEMVDPNQVPLRYKLQQNYPNPFNPSTIIEFHLPAGGYTILEIFNTLGEKQETMIGSYLPAGIYRLSWHAAQFPSGIYFYRITCNNFQQVKRMILTK